MDEQQELFHMAERAMALGAFKASVVPVEQIPFDASLRKACEANYCGNYGKNWTCPPDVGPIDELIAQAKAYKYALVFQTVGTLQDSFDLEGMQEAFVKHREVTKSIALAIEALGSGGGMLQLSAGGCIVCEKCAKRDNEPCRYPDQAVASLEAYGIFVAKLAKLADMNYIDGKNTVTYFGAYLLS